MKKQLPVVLAAVVIAVLAVFLLERLAETLLAQVLVLVVLAIVVMGVGIVLRPEKALPLVCDPFVLQCAFFSQFLVIGPIAVVGFGYGLSQLTFAHQVQPRTVVIVLGAFMLMIASMIAGYQQRLGVILASVLPEFRPSGRKLSGIWAESLVLVASLGGCIGWIQYQGGLLRRLATPYGQAASGGAMFLLAQNGIVVGTLLMAWRVIHARTRTTASVVAFGSLMAFDLLYFGIVFGVRKYLLFLFFGLLAIVALRRGSRSIPKARVALTLLLLLVFFSVWGTIRNRPLSEMFDGTSDARQAPRSGFQSGYFQSVADPFSTVCVTWEIFPESEPFRHGATLLVTLLGFVPRAVWPGKPVGIGKELTRYFVGPFYQPTEGLSLAPTMLGDFYINFGWPGVILGGFLMGIVCRTIASYAVKGIRDGVQTRAARVLIPSFFVMSLGEVRADMASMLAFWGMTFVPLLGSLAFFNFDYEHGPELAPAEQRAPEGGGIARDGYPGLGPALRPDEAAQGPAGPAFR
jgi:oligosaccharide repeat unit polymerase